MSKEDQPETTKQQVIDGVNVQEGVGSAKVYHFTTHEEELPEPSIFDEPLPPGQYDDEKIEGVDVEDGIGGAKVYRFRTHPNPHD